MFTDRTGELRSQSLTGLARIALGLAAALTLLAVSAPATFAAHPRAHHRAHFIRRVCRTPRPGTASCMALRLLPAGTQGTTPVAAAASTRAARVRRAVKYKTPEPGYLTPQLLHEAYAEQFETTSDSLQTIAVVDAYNDPTAESDLAVYDKQFGLPECTTANGCFQKVNQDGKPSPLPATEGGWAVEISIDVQMAHSICDSCKILLVEATGEKFSQLGAGVEAAVKDGATEVSNSYGAAEEPAMEGEAAYYDHPGVVVTASSGDCGYLNLDCVRKNGPARASPPTHPTSSPLAEPTSPKAAAAGRAPPGRRRRAAAARSSRRRCGN